MCDKISNKIYDKLSFNKNKYLIIDNFLENNFALDCQQEILNSDKLYWDRYENPFEKKIHGAIKIKFPKIVKIYLINYIHRIS